MTIAIVLAGTTCLPAAAQADFGIDDFDVAFTSIDGSPATQAGSHPFAMTTSFAVNLDGDGVPEGQLRDLFVAQAPGLLGNTTAYPRCMTVDFLDVDEGVNGCTLNTAIGVAAVSADEPGSWHASSVFNLIPPPGMLLRLGFTLLDANVVVDVGLNPDPPHNAISVSSDISQTVEFLAAKIQLWGDPSSPAHDAFRGNCYGESVAVEPGEEFAFSPEAVSCPVASRGAFITLPTRCSGSPPTSYAGDSYENPGAFLPGGQPDLSDPDWVTGGVLTPSLTGCGKLAFSPSISAGPTTSAARSTTGFDFSLDVHNEGLFFPGGISQSLVRDMVVALPEGMTLDSSIFEGLEGCSEADLAEETPQTVAGVGCPDASRVGTVEVESPLVGEPLEGSLFVADAFPALYMVVKSPELGIVIEQTAEIESDPETGQLLFFAEDIPPTAAFSHLELHLDEAGSPLLSPPLCGAYEVETEMAPWSGTAPILVTSAFQIVTGPNEGPCPSEGVQPAEPGAGAGSANAIAASGQVAGAAPALRDVGHPRRRCPKGKRRARRHGKVRCVEKHKAKSKARR